MKVSLYRRSLVIIIMSLFVTSILPGVNSFSPILVNTIYVDDDSGADFSNIQDAIDAASNGDTIFVYNGIYYENLHIDKKLHLIGEDKTHTIVDGSKVKDVIFISSDCVSISGFTIQNSGKSGRDSGIEIHSDYNMILDNIIINNTIGIFLRDSNNDTILENTIFSNSDYGIYLHSSINNLITHNVVYYNRWGIYIYHSSSNNIIRCNTICSNNHYGIWTSWSRENIISANSINMNKEYGIILSGSVNSVISENNISDNFEGLYLARCNSNTISRNNFQNNNQDASFMDGNNIWKGNYWNEPRFLPKPILDTTSSLVPKIDFDWHPARTPCDIPSSYVTSSKNVPSITLEKEYEKKVISDLPPYFNWRDINGIDYTTPVKNQVPAPTCEAYALCASLETLMQYQIGYPYEPDLSETHLYFYAGGTCRGGGVLLGDAAEYLIEHGVPDEGCFPDPHRAYDYTFESLPDWESRAVKIQEWGWVENDIESIKHALIEHGPLIICIVQRAGFFSYNGGIYKPLRGQQIVNGHVITIVGYDDGQRCWIIKNSAGENWGEEGYVRLSYDADSKSHPIIWPFYGGTGILYIDGLYGNLMPDVPKIQIENLRRHHTYLFGKEFPTRFKDLRFVEKAVPRIIYWTIVKVEVENANGVKFYLDGKLQYVDGESPFEWKISAPFGSHTIEAIAFNEKHLSKGIADVFVL